jgi:vitamin B12 transporter
MMGDPLLRRVATASIVVVALLERPVWAQDAGAAVSDAAPGQTGSPDAVAPAEVELPKLLASVEAVYPSEATAAGVEGVVPLRLTIDAVGRVTEAEVLEPRGYGLDEAARTAALQFRFQAARRRGQPIPARIRYDYLFELKPGGEAPATGATVPTPGAAATATAPPAASTSPPAQEQVTDVVVRGAAQRLRESAEAVTVVETTQARRESADLGEVLNRTQGISIRRAGGLGSGARFSLNGLTDDQIRFFFDGVPLDVAGWGFGLESVPVNLIERAEVYRGIVPIRFGADALGGAVNLVSPENVRGSRAAGSLQLGSFETYRLTLAARHTHAPSGLYVSVNGFLDHADNDYAVDVEVPDEKGRLHGAEVHRFHDGYDAYGGGAEVGFVDRPWARRLILRVFGTRRDKELQHNIVMSVPYGEARYWIATRGVSLRYEQPRFGSSGFGAHALLVAGRQAIDFKDLSPFVYDWFGRRIRERVRPGEIGLAPADERIWQHTGLGRFGVSYTPTLNHSFRLVVSPTFADRKGRDRLVVMGRDPLSAERRYLSVVSGVEYEADVLGDRVESITFGKSYLFRPSSEETLPGNIFRRLEQNSRHFGVGEGLRLRVARYLWVKASYEWATRLPTPDELFGNGVLIVSNLRLVPERSHNGNLSLTLDLRATQAGEFRGEVNAFVRHSDNLIVLLGNDMVFSYQNVYTSRSQGLETSAGWTSPGEYLSVDGNVTWQSVRNQSDSGTFRDFKGDRIPNRPWLFANLQARTQLKNVSGPTDSLMLSYYLRYVKGFFRGWESLGLREFKQVVPDQTTHALALTYLATGKLTQTWSAEIQNLTDAKAYDFFGVERPGRAFYVKVTAEY